MTKFARTWTDSEIRILTIAWNRGETIASIALKVDHTKGAIKHKAKALGLERRRKLGLPYQLRLDIDQKTRAALEARCFERGVKMADYVRRLIKRDLGI